MGGRARSRFIQRLITGGVAATAVTGALLSTQVIPAAANATIGWGMHAGPSKKIPNKDNRQYIADAESLIQRKFVYDPRYYIFGVEPIISARENWAKSVGKTPFIHLDMGGCFTSGCMSRPTWAQVASGTYDSYLTQQAGLLKNFGSRVILNYGNEANLQSQNRGTPQQYKAAFNHIVSVFRNAGVSNVSYALTITNTVFIKGQADTWYPGDNTVDIIAPTGYNWACVPGQPNFGKPSCGQRWKSFQAAFSAPYAYTVRHGKTMMVAETGSAEDPYHAGRKAQWILDMAHTAKGWPALRGIIWFQAGQRLDYWKINSSQSALDAYICVGHDPAFGGGGPTCAGT
jgi:hypothetical protein